MDIWFHHFLAHSRASLSSSAERGGGRGSRGPPPRCPSVCRWPGPGSAVLCSLRLSAQQRTWAGTGAVSERIRGREGGEQEGPGSCLGQVLRTPGRRGEGLSHTQNRRAESLRQEAPWAWEGQFQTADCIVEAGRGDQPPLFFLMGKKERRYQCYVLHKNK